jgi:NAD(P)-dependent dehydrogenase (short-subunit alcohol dehydrogenase family)
MGKKQFEDKHILITGPAAGIGKAIAIALSRCGARLICIDVDSKGLDNLVSGLEGEGHRSFVYDLAECEGIQGLGDQILSSGGPIDGLVHCVGIRSRRPIAMIDSAHLTAVLRTNFVSFVELIRYFTKKGRYHEGLSIVGISSISSHRGAPAVTAYSASKAAMEGAIRCLARELASRKIRLNAVVPGQIDTPAYEALRKMTADQADPVLERQYLGLGEPGDVAEAVLFLLSERSRLITGSSLPVDGGFLSS